MLMTPGRSMISIMMKALSCLLVCIVLISGCAAAEQQVLLPGGRYVIDVPDWMEYSDPVDGDAGMEAYISDDLEIDFTSYEKTEAVKLGMPETLKETAKQQWEEGKKTEIRKVNGIEMLVFRTEDEEDGTPGIVYVFEDGELIIEINFWYATREAADLTKTIMESIRETVD